MIYYGDGKPSVPVRLAGDGVRMAIDLALRTLGGPPGVIAMEEPENFMHPGARRICAEILWAAVARGEQIIVSTHSLEFLDDLLHCEATKLDQIALFKMSLKNGALTAALVPGAEAEEAREILGQDLRV
jgi:predicted ATPase